MTSRPFLGNQDHIPCSQEAQDYPAERASPGKTLRLGPGPCLAARLQPAENVVWPKPSSGSVAPSLWWGSSPSEKQGLRKIVESTRAGLQAGVWNAG